MHPEALAFRSRVDQPETDRTARIPASGEVLNAASALFNRPFSNTRIEFTPDEVQEYFSERAPAVKQTRAAEWRGPCPIHGGKDDNFAVNTETGCSFCHSQCGRGWDLLGLEMAITGAGFKEAKAEVFRIVGRDAEVTFRDRIEATYDYTDEHGELLYQIVRLRNPKGFFQRRPNGNGAWINKKCKRQVLYRSPEVLGAPIVFVVEGEKDVETMRSHGFVATTNACGADAPWLDSYTAAFTGCEVILIPDNDLPGRERVIKIAHALTGKVARLAVLELPGCKDVSEWFSLGHSARELIAQIDSARGTP
jgi:DNA primase